MRAFVILIVAALAGCVADNPDYTGHVLDVVALPPDAGSTAADLSHLGATCGRVAEPCCLDAAGRTFCTAGACYGERCGVPDLAVPPDLRPPLPDLAWRPDLTGGQCVPRCGACSTHIDCCRDGEWLANCYNDRGDLVAPGEVGHCTPGHRCW